MNPWNPAPYQGGSQKRRYFEGWYFKLVTSDRSETWSIIPGISRGAEESDSSAFVQVIEGKAGRTWWFEYPAASFSASERELDIVVGKSRFSCAGIELDLGEGEDRFEGRIGFGPFAALPFRVLAPGVMGPFGLIPFMECYHGLVSLDHGVAGWLAQGGHRTLLDGGRGYVEKDWGSSMPRSWIWTQSNNFELAGDSFMFSLARIPWLGSSFNGFLCAARLGGEILLEATWTGAGISRLVVRDDRVDLTVSRRGRSIEASVGRQRGGILRAPVDGLLSRRIAESVDATIDLRWTEGGVTRFEGRAVNAGLEVVGDAEGLGGSATRRPGS